MPELKRDTAPPMAVTRAPLPRNAKLCWYLKATYPAPSETIWLRFSKSEAPEYREYLDVLTAQGKSLQRYAPDPSPSEKPPLACEARYLEPGRKHGPLLYLRDKGFHHVYTFPDGFAGIILESSVPSEDRLGFVTDNMGRTAIQAGSERRVWTGVSFAVPSDEFDIVETAAPLAWKLAPTKDPARCTAAFFDRFYFLRWITRGEKGTLEVRDKSGRRLAAHSLPSSFGTSPRENFISGTWLDARRKRYPVILLRSSDTVVVHVFGAGLRSLIAVQDFSDSSSSIAATTLSFGRNKSGILTITESYSERPDEEGNGGESHDTVYYWTGKAFQAK